MVKRFDHLRRVPAIVLVVWVSGVGGMSGCAGRAELLPNPDPALRRTAAEFAFDAARRHPYPSDAARGGEAMAQAEVNYVLDTISLVNYSEADWTDVTVWVNGEYVLHLPTIQGGPDASTPGPVKRLPFRAFYGADARSMPLVGYSVDRVELSKDGTLYDVRSRMAD